MGLKQSIVVKNRYTQKKSNGSGSRGSSPGAYVTGYMARTDAVENINAYVQTYMMREDAIIVIDDVNPKDGVAFNSDHLSMSYAQVEAVSDQLQSAFDEGGTVLETILSFDHEYLVANKIVPADLVVQEKGDYRGQVDHLRLRSAIAHGMKRLEASGRFDEMTYVAVIQVDTQHVHCHIALADTGDNPVVGEDGRPKGKLSDADMLTLRRGIDSHLDVQKSLSRYANNTAQTRQTLIDYTKTSVAQALDEKTLPRAIIQSLPANKKLWRAGSKAQTMRGAQALVRSYVQDSFDIEGSPFAQAYQALEEYADYRTEREGLSAQERQLIMDKGLNRIYVSCENVIFSHLRSLSDEELTSYGQALTVRVDDDKSADQSEVEDENSINKSMLEHSLEKVRTYKKRYQDARDVRDTTQEVMDQIDEQDEQGFIHPNARFLYLHMQAENAYAQGVMSKYNQLDPLAYDVAKVRRDFTSLERQAESIASLNAMISDRQIANSSESVAESLGIERYGQFGGHLVRTHEGRDLLTRRLERDRRIYFRDQTILTSEWDDRDIVVTSHSIDLKPRHELSEVAGYDLHQEAGSLKEPLRISERVKKVYQRVVDTRTRYLQAAKDYLIKTKQEDQLFVLNEDDINQASAYLDELETIEPEDDGSYVIVPWAAPWAQKVYVDDDGKPLNQTVDLNHQVLDEVKEDIDQAVADINTYLSTAKESTEQEMDDDPLAPWSRVIEERYGSAEVPYDDSPEF